MYTKLQLQHTHNNNLSIKLETFVRRYFYFLSKNSNNTYIFFISVTKSLFK